MSMQKDITIAPILITITIPQTRVKSVRLIIKAIAIQDINHVVIVTILMNKSMIIMLMLIIVITITSTVVIITKFVNILITNMRIIKKVTSVVLLLVLTLRPYRLDSAFILKKVNLSSIAHWNSFMFQAFVQTSKCMKRSSTI